MTGVPFATFDRRSGIGASVLPAIMGDSPWATPASVWLDLVGLAAPRESDAMRVGRDLEATVLRLTAREADRRMVANHQTFTHPDWPAVPLYATPDGFVQPRRVALVECKVVAHRFDDWRDGPPSYVQDQVQAQLACLPRAQSAIVGALIGGEIKTWRVERDAEFQAALPGLVAAWWADYIVADQAPDAETDADRWALLRAGVPMGRAERIATPDEQRIGTALRGLLAEAARIDQAIQVYRLELADYARDSDVLGVGWRATWASRSTVDWRALVADQAIPAAVIAAHTRAAPTFTFRQGRDDSE